MISASNTQAIGGISGKAVTGAYSGPIPTVDGETQNVIEALSSEIGALQKVVSELMQRLSPVLSGGEVTLRDNTDGAIPRNCALSASIESCKNDIIQTRATISAATNQLCI